MSDLTPLLNPFLFSELEVRTAVDEHGEVWFCAKDVCAVLDISWSGRGNTLKSLPETWVMVSYHETIKGERETIFINEPGVFKLIFRSNKPKAEEFANWVCEEVLPQIRKNGFFGELSPKEYIAVVQQISRLEFRLTDSKNAFTHELLLKPLQNLCNMAGQPMPDIALISRQIDQSDLIEQFGGLS